MEPVGLIFLLLVIFQLKHFLADYPLQGAFMLGKFSDDPKTWVPALLAHVGVHAAFTFTIANVVFLLYGLDSFVLAIEIALFDAAVHFAMDRIKAGKSFLGRFKALSAREYVDIQRQFKEIERLVQEFSKEGVVYDGHPQALHRSVKGNTYFWWALGFDQLVHHLTDIACLYFILKTIRVTP